MQRPSYREAIRWLAENDDNDWLEEWKGEDDPLMSVTGVLVRDLFDVATTKLVTDLRKAITRISA